jgi:hypothetical protein
MPEDELLNKLIDRLGRRGYGTVNEAVFRPLNISDKVIQAFQKNADKLGIDLIHLYKQHQYLQI